MDPRAVSRAFYQLPQLIWSGVRPTEPLAWYDRVIRVAGGVVILLVLVGGLILLAVEVLNEVLTR